MAVEFHFVMSDVDAQNLFDAVRDAALSAQEHGRMTTNMDEANWFSAHAKYLHSLAAKMKNKRVDSK